MKINCSAYFYPVKLALRILLKKAMFEHRSRHRLCDPQRVAFSSNSIGLINFQKMFHLCHYHVVIGIIHRYHDILTLDTYKGGSYND